MALQVRPFQSHDSFATYQKVREYLKQGQINQALLYYLQKVEWTPNRTQLEWELVWQVSDAEEDIASPPAWPEELLRQPSGAVLAVVVTQQNQYAFPFPNILLTCPPLPRGIRTLLARTLMLHADPRFLAQLSPQPNFLSWLVEEAEAIGPCLVLAHRLEFSSFLAQQFPRWLACGLHYPDTPAILQLLCKDPTQKERVLQALKLAYCFFQSQADHLFRLLKVAYELKSYETALAFSEELHLHQLFSTDRSYALAIRIASLAESGREREALEEFRLYWMPLRTFFPFPEKLLYPMQKRGDWDLEKHLLEHCQLTESTPTWVELHFLLFRQPQMISNLLQKWEALFQQRQQHWIDANSMEPHILYGLTSVYLQAQSLMEREWKGELEKLWKTLYSYESMQWMAGSFLVLLSFYSADWQDCISCYKRYLHNAPLSDPFVQRATNAYIQVLLRQKQWTDVLSLFSHQDMSQLKQLLSHSDYVYARQMSRIITLPESEADIPNWFGHWEYLLCCSLNTARITGVLEQFIHIQSLLSENILLHPDFEDISLQILCRGKAEIERIIAAKDSIDKKDQEILEQLRTMNHRGTYTLLSQQATPTFHGFHAGLN